MARNGLPSPDLPSLYEMVSFFKPLPSDEKFGEMFNKLPYQFPFDYPDWDAVGMFGYHYVVAIMYAAGLMTPDTPWEDVHQAVKDLVRIQEEMRRAVSSYDVPDGDRRLGWWSLVGAAVLKKLRDPEITEEERALYRAYEIYLSTFYADSSIFCLDLVTIEGVEVAVAAPAPELALAAGAGEADEAYEAGEAGEDRARQAEKAKARCRKARCRKARR